MSLSGGCLCGDLRYETSGAPFWVGHCHCRWCRKHSGSAFLTFVMFETGQVTWLGTRPAVYESSPGVERGFCPTCGSTLTFARPEMDEMSVLAGTLDDPDAVQPSMHIFTEQRCAWVQADDGLPSYGRYPPGGEDREID